MFTQTESQSSEDSVRQERGVKPRRSWLSFLLSLFLPGLGQLYNGSVRKALLAYGLSFSAGLSIFIAPGLLLDYGYQGFQVVLGAGFLLSIGIALEAAWSANRHSGLRRRPYDRWWIYLLVLLSYNLLIQFVLPNSGLRGFLGKRTLARPFSLSSGSMMPTLTGGDFVMSDARPRSDWRAGDIVVIRLEQGPPIIKPIVATSGDTIEIADGVCLINGQPFQPEYWVEPFSDDFSEQTVPEGHHFVLGDNINNSRDSRFLGTFPKEKVIGLVLYCFWGTNAETEFTRLSGR